MTTTADYQANSRATMAQSRHELARGDLQLNSTATRVWQNIGLHTPMQMVPSLAVGLVKFELLVQLRLFDTPEQSVYIRPVC